MKSGRGQELEIEIHYFYKSDRTSEESVMNNPVVCRDEQGNIYRTHGEWRYAKHRLQRLLAGEAPAEPIRLGKDDAGWSAGID